MLGLMLTTYGPVSVTFHGGLDDDETMTLAKITTLGDSPNARIKLYQYDAQTGQFHEFDTLIDAKVDEKPHRILAEGISERHREEVGLSPDESIIRWEIDTSADCQGCG